MYAINLVVKYQGVVKQLGPLDLQKDARYAKANKLQTIKLSHNMIFPAMWYMYVRPVKPQISLRIRTV